MLDELLECVLAAVVDEIVGQLATLVDATRALQPAPRTSPVIHRPLSEAVVIERAEGGYVVSGRDALRAVALSDLTDSDALAAAQRRLKRLGVDKALKRAGARAGDPVRIGTVVFEWEPD